MRKDHFNFFKQFEEPFFSVCVNVDCTQAYLKAKENGVSFFLYYLYCSLEAANRIEAFRCRILEDEVFVYDVIHASSTINRPNETFGFSYIDYKDTLQEFVTEAKKEIDRVQASTGLIPSNGTDNLIHYSAIPWVNFTGLTHARSFSFPDSIPKISFGKMIDNNGIKNMPLSITVHHGLMDGFHVGQYIDLFQELLNQ
jgi:chloramphenicol O-acetyltransferase type A